MSQDCAVWATQTKEHAENKLHRLYEQARRLRLSKEETQRRVVDYLPRWQQWLHAGLGNVAFHTRPWEVNIPAGIAVL